MQLMLDIIRYGCPGTPLSDVVDQATRFIGGCYRNKVGAETTMSDIRYKIWCANFGNTATSASKIHSLPPSTEAFTENVKRAHLRTFIWKAAVSLDPQSIDAVEYGYARHVPSCLVPCYKSLLLSLLQYQLEYHLRQMKSYP